MIYSFNRQLTPPTCISDSVSCHFTNHQKLDLLVVKGNLLCCYRIYTIATGIPVARLELLHEFPLEGVVTSIGVVKLNSTAEGEGVNEGGRDSLLLTFLDAKMSLVEYSTEMKDLITVSMHNYEREDLRKDLGYKGIPTVRVDHESRCAIMMFYKNQLAILPFKYEFDSSNAIDGNNSSSVNFDENDERRKYPFHPSFVLAVNEIDEGIRNVIDFTFLYGYLEPTLAILYEYDQTVVGRLAQKKDTVSLVVVSLDVFSKQYPILYKVDCLPYNCTRIQAVPSPLGGILIFSNNALIHLDQTHTPGFAALVNPFFDMESHFKPVPTDDGSPSIPVKNKPPSIYIKTGKFSDCKDLGVSLDGSHATFLSPDVVLIVLRTGEMLQATLIGDDNAGSSWKRKRGGVKDIKITKLGLTTSSPSCITSLVDLSNFMKPQILSRIISLNGVRCYSNYFFLGSIVSDAVLIQYFEQIEEKAVTLPAEENADMGMAEDELDAEIYGGSFGKDVVNGGNSIQPSFKFRICDNILVTGPIRNIAIGQPVSLSQHEYVGEPLGAHLEVVACGGHDTHGSLLVMHQSVRPQIISSFPLGDADDIWSILLSSSSSQQQEDDQFHKYLVISRGSGTSILKTGEALEEVEQSGFFVSGPTVCVGTALNRTVIIQVYPNGILVLSPDAQRMSETLIGSDEIWIVSCCIKDPYVVVLLNTGELHLLNVNALSTPLMVEKELQMDTPIACIALYTDDSPIQHLPTVGEAQIKDKTTVKKGYTDSTSKNANRKPIVKKALYDDDDMDLYGESIEEAVEETNEMDEDAENKKTLFEEEDEKDKLSDVDEDQTRSAPVRHWCFLVDDYGTLRILSMPDLVERFVFYDFRLAPRFVHDHVVQPAELQSGNYPLQVDEISVVTLGSDQYRNTPFVIMRTQKFDIFIYRIIPAFEHSSGTSKERLSIRMVRMENNNISREPQPYSDAEGDKLNPIEPPVKPPSFIKKIHLIPFEKIGSDGQQLYAGVVVTGQRPTWIMMALSGVHQGLEFMINEGFQDNAVPSASLNSSNALRIHPMLVDGPLSSFSPIHNVNIPYGFAYINEKGLFRLCQLLPHFSYDRDWAVCKVSLGRSAQRISYHSISQTYVLASSTPSVFEIDTARYMAAVAAGVIADGEELPEAEKRVSGIQDVIEVREPGMYLPEISAYNLELISPITWETIDIIKMSQFEQILTVKVVELASKENTSGRKLFVAIGTGFMRSEDLSCRGRVIVYDVIDVVPEPGRPQTNHKLKQFFKSEEKSPVTALCACNGYLLAAIGTKIMMFAMEDGDLNGVAFLDVNVYVVSLSAVKNFILISDAFKSVWFVAFQEEPPKLTLLGKDLYPVHVLGSEFIIGESDLGMIVSDDQKNLHVMTFEPYAVQSLGGQRLLRRGEINLGYEIQAFASLRLKPSRPGVEDIFKTGIIAGTSEGGLAMIVPVSEKLFKRLYGLYSRMVTHLEHYAGLNPRGYRQIKMPLKSIHASSVMTGPPGPRGILDGDLLYRFLQLSLVNQRELAKAIGSRDDRIIDDFLELSMVLEYF